MPRIPTTRSSERSRHSPTSDSGPNPGAAGGGRAGWRAVQLAVGEARPLARDRDGVGARGDLALEPLVQRPRSLVPPLGAAHQGPALLFGEDREPPHRNLGRALRSPDDEALQEHAVVAEPAPDRAGVEEVGVVATVEREPGARLITFRLRSKLTKRLSG